MPLSFPILALVLSLLISYPAGATENFVEALNPPDSHSPRETIEAFLSHMTTAHRLLTEAAKLSEEDDGLFFHPSEAVSLAKRAAIHFGKALQCLDLSRIPEVYRDDIGMERALMLKEIMDRIPVPLPTDIPGREAAGIDSAFPMSKWRIPGTEIRVKRVDSGEIEGYYLFSSETVGRIPLFYRTVKDLPYKDGFGVTRGFFEWYNDTPGHLLPPKWSRYLPAWTMTEVYDNTLWQWMALLAVLAAGVWSFSFSMGFFRLKKKAHESELVHRTIRLLFTATSIGISCLCRYMADSVINVSGTPLMVSVGTLSSFVWLLMTWGIFQVFVLLVEFIILSPKIDPNSVDASMLRTMSHLMGITASMAFLVYGASKLGIPLASVVTGLGIAGLAISLAAKPTVENVIGGITLFADKPVRVGDLCQIGGTVGTVLEIGIRSTKLRTLDRTIMSIPNAEFSQLQIMNLDRRDKHLFETSLGLRYETSMDQLKWVLESTKEMLMAHPKVLNSPPIRVRFSGFGAYSLDVSVRAFIHTRDWEVFLAIREDLLFRISDIVERSGSGFAFPSTTAYLTEDVPPGDTAISHAPSESPGV